MLPLHEILIVLLLGIGSLFSLLAAVGILRMPDVYTRMLAASKAVTLGTTAIVCAAAVHFREADVVARCLLVCGFLFVTIPAASHLIARAAHRAGEPLAPETVIDELGQSADDGSGPEGRRTPADLNAADGP
jgi:multicomponent Na+:H+ antiporter subunit G